MKIPPISASIEDIKNNNIFHTMLFVRSNGNDTEFDNYLDQLPDAIKQNNIISTLLIDNLEPRHEPQLKKIQEALTTHPKIIDVVFKKADATNVTLDENLNNTISTNRNKQPQNAYECFLQKSGSLKKAWAEKQNQEIYARICYANTANARTYLHNNRSTITANQFYDFLARQRGKMALHFQQEDFHEYGRRRTTKNSGAGTFIPDPDVKHSQYDDYYDELNDRLPRRGIQVLKNSKLYTTISQMRDDTILIKHTQPDLIPSLFEMMEPAFQAVINADNPSLQVIENIARVAWHIAHAMPSKRGSAATMEMMVHSLFDHAGYPPLQYENKNGIPLDIEALFEPDVEKFVRKFPAWFPALAAQATFTPGFFKNEPNKKQEESKPPKPSKPSL